MIVHSAKQGTPEWAAARAGIPTASKFHVLMTAEARKGKLTAGAAAYLHEKLAEWVLGQPLDDGVLGGFAARGTALEDEGIADYQFRREIVVERVGLITNDAGTVGASVDGLVGGDGVVEVKCYELKKHIAALLKSDDSHLAQIQGGLWITERSWCDRVYYNPILPAVTIQVKRDDDYIADLCRAVNYFLGHLEAAKTKLLSLGVKPRIPAQGPEAALPGTQGGGDRPGHAPEAPEAPGASRAAMVAELAELNADIGLVESGI